MEEIAQVYSRSLFEVARESGRLDVVREQVGAFADALEERHDLQVFFFSPYFSTEEKRDGLRRAVVDADPAVLHFLELLIENHRMPALFRIRRELDARWRAERRLLPVQVTSAIALDERIVQDLGERVRSQTGREVELTATVDPDILGGIVLRVGNAILDASIRTRLESLRKQVVQA